MRYKKRTSTIEATQWFKLGDHPKVKQLFIHKGKADNVPCRHCQQTVKLHGWLNGTVYAGELVCPGDYIINSEYTMKPDVFEITFEPA